MNDWRTMAARVLEGPAPEHRPAIAATPLEVAPPPAADTLLKGVERLETMPRPSDAAEARWEQIKRDGRLLIDSWGSRLAHHGWGLRDLFGLDPDAEHGWIGLAFTIRSGRVANVERDVVTIQSEPRTTLFHYRREPMPPPIWLRGPSW